MNPTHDLATVHEIITRMRAEASLLDYARYPKIAVQLESFADSLDREYLLETREPEQEDAEATRNVAADEGRF